MPNQLYKNNTIDCTFFNRKKILITASIAALIVLLFLCIQNKALIVYLYAQAKGQYHILSHTTSIDSIINDPKSDSLIVNRLQFIQTVKAFSENSLGLHPSDNYSTFYDQHKKPLMTVISASQPYALKAYQWSFPFFGKFPYKGFFDNTMALKEKERLQKKGLDTNSRHPGAWSTLGWFVDPVFSGFLNYSDGDLADLIIHELTHGTIFVKDSIIFNENLASFIGQEGAALFLKTHRGETAVQQFRKSKKDRRLFSKYVLQQAKKLDDLYKKPDFIALSNDQKQQQKNQFITDYLDGICDVKGINQDVYYHYYSKKKTNNTFFLSYLRYRASGNLLHQQLQEQFGGDITQMIQYYKTI